MEGDAVEKGDWGSGRNEVAHKNGLQPDRNEIGLVLGVVWLELRRSCVDA
jgi:hypothetical protein